MRYILILISLGTLLACGGNETVETGENMPLPAASTSSSVPPVASAPPAYNGESSLEERILESDVVAKVRLISAQAVAGTAAWSDNAPDETSPAAVWEFRFRVLEYLKGTGANEITAVVLVRGRSDDTKEDVNRALPTITAERDTQWDSREAIVFLKNSDVAVPSTSQEGHYFIGFRTAAATNEDGYTIASRWDRLWLPDASAAANAASSGDQRFLLETRSTETSGATRGTSGATRTISLSDMKSNIATLNAELNRGDGSDAYQECIRHTYRYKRIEHHYVESSGKDWGYTPKYPKHTVASGLAVGSSVHEDEDGGGSLPDKRERLWLDGGDADLFGVKFGDPIPYDWSGDGVNDSIRYTRRIEVSRPLPEGEYRFHYNNRKVFFIPCDGYTVRYEWTVTVTAPAGTLHELFFDPVADGSTVAADSSNGILKPASFTDANNASATIQRIEWASGTVKMKLSPHAGLTGQTVDFTELDGSVSLSLAVDDATVDAANNTLSWSVLSQPWHDGDKLMLRIHKAVPAPQDVTVSLADGEFTISWSAVTGAAEYRAQYRTGGSEVEWTNLDAATGTSQTFSPEGGVACGTTYEFRVQARGDGTTYSAAWGTPSESASHTTGACNQAPVFGSATYSFTVAENASVWHTVGTVSASDPDEGDSVLYYITAGNGAGRFEISSGNDGGLILVWGALDYETASSYTLTVEARDGKAGGTSSATVDISVTDVAE